MYVSSDVLLVALVPRKPTNRQSVAKKPHFVHRETENQPAIRRPCADRCKISASIAARASESPTHRPRDSAPASAPLHRLPRNGARHPPKNRKANVRNPFHNAHSVIPTYVEKKKSNTKKT